MIEQYFLRDGKFVEDIDMKNTSSQEYTSITFNEIDVEKAKNHLNSKSHGSIKKIWKHLDNSKAR